MRCPYVHFIGTFHNLGSALSGMSASPGPHSFVLALGLPRFDVCMGQNTKELLTLKTLAEGSLTGRSTASM